jgi:signal transduction histidine kinase
MLARPPHGGASLEAQLRWHAARILCVVFASYAIVGGAVSFAGWLTGNPLLIDWWNTSITIKANAALCLMLAGNAILLLELAPRWRIPLLALTTVPALLGVTTLAEHLFEINLGIDTLMFDEPPGSPATAAPGRMGPPAAMSFLLISLGTWMAGRASRNICSIALPLFVLGICLQSMVGYAYGAEALYAAPRLTGIAIQTATMIAALACALLCAQPARQPLKTLFENSTAGVLARRVIPLAILVPVLLGWARMEGQDAGIFDLAFGTALRTSAEIILLTSALWWVIKLARARDQQQREADRRKDEFLATLAHELRNPLAPIRMAAALAKKPQITEAQRQWCNDVIERQVGYMSLLLDDLLDVSRITRGALELRRAPVQLATLIENAVETSRPLLDAKRHTLTVKVPEDATINVDALRMAQVVSNLLNNAAKYTPEGGTVQLAAVLAGDDLTIELRDNGIGIEPGDLAAIFTMFAQIKAAREYSGAGLGIGLALTRGLVELHGGTLTARSDGADQGSTFTVRLPGARAR